MKSAVVLLVMLSNQGHWFGGRPGTVTVQWAVETGMPAAVLDWRLGFGEVAIKSGRLELPVDGDPARLSLTLPEIRVPTAMRFVYHARMVDSGDVIAKGEASIHLYPDSLLDAVARRVRSKHIIVWDGAEGLPALLADAKIPHVRIDKESGLQLSRPDIILVGRDQIPDAPFAQSALLAQAKSGATVLVFWQTQLSTLAGYPLAVRAAPERLEWRSDHLLARHVRLLESCLPVRSRSRETSGPELSRVQLRAIRLPADEPATEIAFWPREVPGDGPVPIDALLLVKAVGKGRIVLCQIPLGPWQDDPRSQLFLADALDYLTTRVEPLPVGHASSLPLREDPQAGSSRHVTKPNAGRLFIPSGGSP